MTDRPGSVSLGAAGARTASSTSHRPEASAHTATTEAENREYLLDDAVGILTSLAQQAGVPRRPDAWRDRIAQLASRLALEDAMHAELNVPASERRRNLRRVVDRLERLADGDRRWRARIKMLNATAADVQKIWPDFDKTVFDKSISPENASRLAAQLRRADAALDRSVYGRAAGPTRPDLPLMMAAAGLGDLIQEACGGQQGHSPPVSPGGAWARLLQRVSEIAGRPVGDGGRDLSHTLELARTYAKVEPVPIRTKDTPADQIPTTPEPRAVRATRHRRSGSD